jgi:hypothetical protein
MTASPTVIPAKAGIQGFLFSVDPGVLPHAGARMAWSRNKDDGFGRKIDVNRQALSK